MDMITRIKVYLFTFILLNSIFFGFVSCSHEVIDEKDIESLRGVHITFMFPPEGLGDEGYNDLILIGLQRFYMAYPEISLSISCPETLDEANKKFSDWLSHTPKEGCSRDLFVLASSDYEKLAEQVKTLQSKENIKREVLLFESTNRNKLPLAYFSTTMYGASWLSAQAVSEVGIRSPLIIGAYEGEVVTQSSIKGFTDGFMNQSGVTPAISYLSQDPSGFAMAKEAYENMSFWGQNYNFIFPVAGGSNIGIYRYLREYPRGCYTAGMDLEQSGVCANIMLSIVKKMDLLVEYYLTTWLEEGGFPAPTIYGLESGYVDCIVSPYFKEVLESSIIKKREEAIQYEKEYNKNF